MTSDNPVSFAATPLNRSTLDRARTSCRMESTRAAVKIGIRPVRLRSSRPLLSSLNLPSSVNGLLRLRVTSMRRFWKSRAECPRA